MAVISINLSQSVIDTNAALVAKYGRGTAAEVIDTFYVAAYNFAANHPYYSSASLVGTTGRFNFSDGAYEQYYNVTGVGLSGSGVGSMTSVDMVQPGYYRLAVSGSLSMPYQYVNGSIQTGEVSGTISAASVQTLLPTYSSSYNATLGNTSLALAGNLAHQANGSFSGTITSVTAKAERFNDSSVISGQFNISGNLIQIGQGLADTALSGTMNTYTDTYRDGSYVKISDAAISVSGGTVLNESILANPAHFAGNDVISIELPSKMSSAYIMASGAGNDTITLKGGGGYLSAQGGDGDDQVVLKDSGHAIYGGSGNDTVYFIKTLSNYSITKSGSQFIVKEKATGYTDSVSEFEWMRFSDIGINLKTTAVTASVPTQQADRLIELYVAFFNRVPDADGLVYWIEQLKGGMTISNIAEAFYTAGLQYSAVTGFTAEMTNQDFINLVYKNVMGRMSGADPEGLSYWTQELASGKANRGTLVSTILDSAHTINKTDPTYGFVPRLLDNKITTAKTFAVDYGLSYAATDVGITQGIAIASAVTADAPANVLSLIGLSSTDLTTI